MNRVCPNVRHENITLWSSSWQLKFIYSQFPLPKALNSVFSLIKMSDRDLKFVYLFCQTDTFLFVIETPIRKCKHPFGRNEHLRNVEHENWNILLSTEISWLPHSPSIKDCLCLIKYVLRCLYIEDDNRFIFLTEIKNVVKPETDIDV
jgi:hypothetical protein